MRTYGLVGFPLTHSYSRAFFTNKFEVEQLDAQYVNFELKEIEDLQQVLTEYPNLCGLNVTLPYKTAVMAYLDELDDVAASIGAVNVIAFRKDAAGNVRLKGYNSDVIGFRNSIQPLLNASHKQALILGTGGGAKAVYEGLKQLGISSTYVSRRRQEGMCTYDELDESVFSQYTVIVNASPLGMFPNIDACPNIPYEFLTSNHVLFDLIYNPEEPLFLRKGRERGAVVKNGREMLQLQAVAAWDYWNEGQV